MRQFEVITENKVGALADVCEVLATQGVNIKAVATEIKDGIGLIKLVTEDENTTRETLKKGKFNFSEYDIIPIKMMNRPGELAKVSRMLANAGIDIESIFLLGRDEIGIKVDDLGRARTMFK